MTCFELAHLAGSTFEESAETTPRQRQKRSQREREAALGLDAGLYRVL